MAGTEEGLVERCPGVEHVFNMLNRSSDLGKMRAQGGHFCPFVLSDNGMPLAGFLTTLYVSEDKGVTEGAKTNIGLGIAYCFGHPLAVRVHSGLV